MVSGNFGEAGDADPGTSHGDSCEPHPSAGQLRNFLRPCLLLLVDERPTYGYELHQQLDVFAPTHWEHGTIYRLLNLMEDEGLVSSSWQRSDRGPRRRAYQITESGRLRLREYARDLSAIRNLIVVFLDRYNRALETHVAMLLGAAPQAAGTESTLGGGSATVVIVEGSSVRDRV